MTVHLIKLAVGIETIDHLRERQSQRLAAQLANKAANGGAAGLRILTRNTPRRSDEMLDGGSLYWVIKGQVLARQALTGVEPAVNADGKPRCALLLDDRLVRVYPRRSRPFQGWRYLEAENAPEDLPHNVAAAENELPPEMAAELRELGLI